MCTETRGRSERFEEFNYLTEACYWYALRSPHQRGRRVQGREVWGIPGCPVGRWGPQLGRAETPQGGRGPAGWGSAGAGGRARVGSAGWGGRCGSGRDSLAPRLRWQSPAREVQMDAAGAHCAAEPPWAGLNGRVGPDPAQLGAVAQDG